MSYVFIITPEGRLPEGIKQTLARFIKELAGKTVELDLREFKPTLSESQREYYFAVIVHAYIKYFAAQGKIYNKDQMHDQLMRAIGGFSNPYVNAFTGEPDAGRISITSLTRSQAEGYFTLCRQYAAEKAKPSFDIPEPNETSFYKYDKGGNYGQRMEAIPMYL